MTRPIRFLTMLAVVTSFAVLALTAGTTSARAMASCGIVNASGHAWIVVAKNVSCTRAKQVTRAFAARTSRLHSGQSVVVTTSLLPGFHCVLASKGKPGGSCATAGAAKSVLWLVA